MKTAELPPWIDLLTKEKARAILPRAQIALYVMAGGGFIGRSYAEQPASAYVDSRAGRRPYGSRQLETARQVVIALARKAGLDPESLPPTPNFGNMGVF